ncbi:uncharacterized protein K460DRAFT_297742, partial [Cucurbitaria berberidis CBS 394.84]
ILIFNSYSSYFTTNFINFCDARKILLIVFFFYLIYSIQLLDIVLFLLLFYLTKLAHYFYYS